INKEYSPTTLTRILQEYVKEHNGTLEAFVVIANSITFSGKLIWIIAWTSLFRQSSIYTMFQNKLSSLPATGNSSELPIILGAVLGVVVLVVLVVLVIIIVVKRTKKNRVVPILVKEREAGPDI
ncbi:hypothetical protein LSAT2_022495, partial [Lamellibrachia satsuma]